MTTGQIILAAVAAAVLLFGALAWFFIVRPFRRARMGRMKDPVRATMLVTQMPPTNDEESIWQGGAITGIITIPGQAPFVQRQQAMILTEKYPKAGDVLPLVVDRADPRRLSIQWDEMAAADPAPDGFRRD